MNEDKFSLKEVVDEQKRNGRKRIKEALVRDSEKKLRARKAKIVSILVYSFALSVFVYWFANNYYVRTPLIAQNPIVKKETKALAVLSPISFDGTEETLTDMQIIDQYRFAPILKGIYMLESTYGQNDACKEKGLYNGYGYRQNERENKCYESFAQLTQIVNDWLEERLNENGNNLPEALCYYNTGYAGQDSCKYSQNFMTVLVDSL